MDRNITESGRVQFSCDVTKNVWLNVMAAGARM